MVFTASVRIEQGPTLGPQEQIMDVSMVNATVRKDTISDAQLQEP